MEKTVEERIGELNAVKDELLESMGTQQAIVDGLNFDLLQKGDIVDSEKKKLNKAIRQAEPIKRNLAIIDGKIGELNFVVDREAKVNLAEEEEEDIDEEEEEAEEEEYPVDEDDDEELDD